MWKRSKNTAKTRPLNAFNLGRFQVLNKAFAITEGVLTNCILDRTCRQIMRHLSYPTCLDWPDRPTCIIAAGEIRMKILKSSGDDKSWTYLTRWPCH